MKKTCLAIFFLALMQLTSGQNFKIGLAAGYGNYQLKDLKALQNQLSNYYYILNVDPVQQFPGYFNYFASVEYSLNKRNLVGINAGCFSTGGRNAVSDYSGEYTLDMLLKGTQLGLQYRTIITEQGGLNLYAKAAGGITFSDLSVNEYFAIYHVDTVSDKNSYTGRSFFIEPSAGVFFSPVNHFSVDISFGYQVDIQGEFHEEASKDKILRDLNGDTVHANWSGLRFALGISYSIFRE